MEFCYAMQKFQSCKNKQEKTQELFKIWSISVQILRSFQLFR